MTEKPLAAKISKAVSQEKTILSTFAPTSGTPDVKTSIGVTFNQIIDAVQDMPQLNYLLEQNGGRKEVIGLVEKLHNAVRLTDWTHNEDTGTYQLWLPKIHPQVYISVSQGLIELCKGLRRYPLAAESALGLFRMLQQAQEFLVANNLRGDDPLEVELEQEPVKASPPKFQPAVLSMQDGFEFCRSLQGRVLTIVEATFADKSQREAVKSLVRKEFRRSMEKISHFCLHPNESSTDMYGDEQGV